MAPGGSLTAQPSPLRCLTLTLTRSPSALQSTASQATPRSERYRPAQTRPARHDARLRVGRHLAILRIARQLLPVILSAPPPLALRLATDHLLGTIQRASKPPLTIRTTAGRAQTRLLSDSRMNPRRNLWPGTTQESIQTKTATVPIIPAAKSVDSFNE